MIATRTDIADQPRLIYIDPPYAMNVDHGVAEASSDSTGSSPTGSQSSTLAYTDSWSSDGTYCQFMYDRLMLMREVLRNDGFIFVHCDWRASAWLRLLLDEVFGRDCFRNEIVWRRAPNLGRQASSRQLGRTVDSIFVYSKRVKSEFPGQLPKLRKRLEVGANGRPKGARWDEQKSKWFTTAPRGDYTDKSIERLEREGRTYRAPSGKVYIKYFLEQGGPDSRTTAASDGNNEDSVTEFADGSWYKVVPLDTIWDDEGVRPVRHASKRELAVRYVTQKPESLLRRIIEWASEPGDVVADFFCGSGTTAAAAIDLQRPFIVCDQSDVALAAVRKRLLERGVTWHEHEAKHIDASAERQSAARDSSRVRTKTPRVVRGKAT